MAAQGDGCAAHARISDVGDDSDDDLPLTQLFSTLAVNTSRAAPPPPVPPTTSAIPSIDLRDYQTALIVDADKQFLRGERAVLAYLPTGGGKTRVGAAAMAQWVLSSSASARCLFVVNRRSLLQQTRDALTELGFEPSSVGLIGGDATTHTVSAADGVRVHIAMVQSLHERFRATHSLESYALAVIDECHAAAAPSYLALLGALPTSARVLGLTATPFRSGAGEDLSKVFPRAAWGPSVSALISLVKSLCPL